MKTVAVPLERIAGWCRVVSYVAESSLRNAAKTFDSGDLAFLRHADAAADWLMLLNWLQSFIAVDDPVPAPPIEVIHLWRDRAAGAARAIFETASVQAANPITILRLGEACGQLTALADWLNAIVED